MADMLADAAEWLDDMRTANMSREVMYRRGDEYIYVAATLGSTTYEVVDDAGVTVRTVASDFIVTASDLVLAGEVAEPEIGDQVIVTIGSAEYVYEVLDLGGGGHYQRCDPAGVTLRIHAKRVE